MALLRRIAFKVETVHKVHLLCPIRFMAPIKNAVSALWGGPPGADRSFETSYSHSVEHGGGRASMDCRIAAVVGVTYALSAAR